MIVGVLGALAQDDVKRILSFHVVSQIGYMIMGLGFFTVAGVAGAVLFLVHQIPVKTVMFLAGGLIEDNQGTSALNRVGGLATSKPVIAVLFALPALSLAGIPPFSGFIAKLALVDAGIANGSYVIVAVALVGSMLTLLSMTKIWIGAFWGEVTPAAVPASTPRSVRIMEWSAALAVAVTIGVAITAGPLWRMCEEIATDLLLRAPYVTAVLS
jgi:multicomponent Na+:H+ antiporter subunit D